MAGSGTVKFSMDPYLGSPKLTDPSGSRTLVYTYRMCCDAGLQFTQPRTFPLTETRLGHYMAELGKVITLKPEMIMVVIPNNKVAGP
jgi:hypothetical protein